LTERVQAAKQSSMNGAYEAASDAWRRDAEAFWAQAAESIHWYRRWNHVLDASRAPFYRWFKADSLTPAGLT